MKIHPQAVESLKRYKEDLRAGHTDAAEYWRGQAGAYFTANPTEATIKQIQEHYYVLVMGNRRIGGANKQSLINYAKKQGYNIINFIPMKKPEGTYMGPQHWPDWGNQNPNNPIRFSKDKDYIGVKPYYPLASNFADYSVKSILIQRFHGKPYNRYEYDQYYEYSPEKWSELIGRLNADAVKYNMQVGESQGYASIGPKWTHTPKRNPTGLYQAFHGNPPKKVRQIQFEAPKEGEKLLKIGILRQIEYDCEAPSQHRGVRFHHKSGDIGNKQLESNTILCTNQEGTQLYLIKDDPNSKYPRFSERGILG